MTEQNKARILVVDDEDKWRGILGNSLKASGLAHTVVDNTAVAVTKLESGEFTGVITDGLDGGWQRVVEAARAVGASAVVMSGSSVVVASAEVQGVSAFHKALLDPEILNNAIQTVTSSEKPK